VITPSFSELLHKVTTHKLVISFCRLLEGLPYDGNEEFHGDCSHNYRVAKEEDPRGNLRATSHWIIFKNI
jgi:hypothetical protein